MLHDDVIKFLKDGRVFSRFTLTVTLWMTWKAFQWAAEFASMSPKGGLELAAVIAAVLTPISALQAAVFHTYSKGPERA